MSAVLWQCNLQSSRLALCLCNSWYGILILTLFFSPWPPAWIPVKLILAGGVWRERQKTHRKIIACQGVLTFSQDRGWHWGEGSGRFRPPTRWLPVAVQFRLEHEGGAVQYIWLMRDAMPERAWRTLCSCRAWWRN